VTNFIQKFITMGLSKENQEEMYKEFSDLVYEMNTLILKYGLEETGFVVAAIGSVNYDELDEDDDPTMDIAFSVNVADEEELDEIVGLVISGYQEQERSDTSKVDYWIRRAGGDPDKE